MKKSIFVGLCSLTVILLALALWKVPSSKEPETNSSMVVKNEETVPLPSLNPQEVVEIQLKAMQKNDQPYENHGIEIAFRFASPSNKESTGPLDTFIGLVKNQTYHSLLNFQQYGLDDIEIEGDKALQKVTLIDAENNPIVYFFKLSRQQEEPFANCWMTDGVVRY